MTALTLPSFVIPLIVFDTNSMPKIAFTIVILGSILSFLTLPTIISNAGAIGYITYMNIGHMGVSRLVGSSILILVFYYYLNSKKFSFKLLMIGLIAVNGITLLAAGSRAPLLGLILAVIYYLYQSVEYSNGVIRYSRELKWIVPALILIVFALTKAVQQGYFATIVHRVQMIFKESGGGASLISRSELIDLAVYLFKENPITGVGLGGFAAYHSMHIYPHNIILEILAELGLIGMSLFTLFLSTTIKPIARLINYGREKTWVLLLFYFFINALISGDINTNRMIFSFMSIVVVVYSSVPITNNASIKKQHVFNNKMVTE